MQRTLEIYWNARRNWGMIPSRAWALAVRIEREERTWTFDV